MKKFLLSLVMALGFLASSQAQFDAENLFGGANIGYTRPIGDFSEFAKGGFYWNAEGGYKLMENLGVGLQIQSSIVGAIDSEDGSGLFGLNLYGLNSYMAKGWYTFTDSNVKPYGALGVGLARVAEPDFTVTDSDGNQSTVKGARSTGLASNVELGVSFKGFNISYNFNVGGKSPDQAIINGAEGGVWVLYHTFNIGYIYNL